MYTLPRALHKKSRNAVLRLFVHSSLARGTAMATVGRPRALGDDQQDTVCSLVAAGVSVRQAADFLDCDPRSIRREAQRNEDFRRRLAKAKTEARVHPLETLQRAAQTNWRAALNWMERFDPDRFARPN